MSLFSGPNPRYNPGRIQGYWFRWVLERPTGNGWVAALDSAAVRSGGDNTPIPNRYAEILAAHHCVQEALAPRWNSRHLAGWNEGSAPPCSGDVPQGLSPHADTWVGPNWKQGWPTEHPVEVGAARWPAAENSTLWWRHLEGLLGHLAEQKHPYGMGWALPTTQGTKDADRAAWAQSAHSILAQRAQGANAQAWDHRTGRVVWAIMAYVTAHNTAVGAL